MGDPYKILIIGNNAAKSSELFEKLQLSYPDNNSTEMQHARLEFYEYPDLNLFNRFKEPPIDDSITELIGNTTNSGGVSLFIILICQTEVFSNNMKEMITEIPQDRRFNNEKYFWDHAVVLFSFEEMTTNYEQEVLNSIKRNIGIKEVVGKAGNRYIWMSNSSTKDEIQERILSQCQKVKNPNIPLAEAERNQEPKTPIHGTVSTKQPPEEPIDRVFIMLGRAGIGKSTFGNFMVGGEYNSFEVGASSRSYSSTRSVQSAVTALSPETVSGLGFRDQNTKIRIKVIDQPGMDDAEINLRTHCDNLNAKTFATFLIVVNLNSNRLSDDRCLLLTQLSELLTQASYSFFSHAIIVFTHADEVVRDVSNKEELMQVVRRKIQLPGWEEMGEILQAVNERCIFVNGTSLDESYRIQIMKELFELSKNTLTIRFHGNNNFTSEYLQSKMDVRGDGIVQEEFYNLDFQFHPDLNLFWRDEYRGNNLEKQMENVIQTMISLGEGVSAMVILISLENPFSAPMEELILNLPGCYIPEDDPALESLAKQWWKQAFIVFKVENEGCAKSFVQTNIDRNPRIKSLVGKVSNKWTWVAEDTTARMCWDRMTEMCIAVRKEVAGRNFIQNTVIKEIKGKMKESKDLEGKKTEVRVYTQEFHNLMAKGALAIMESNNSVFVKLGGILFRQNISVRAMRLILKSTRLNNEQIKCFIAKYTNPQDKVSIEEVLRFLDN